MRIFLRAAAAVLALTGAFAGAGASQASVIYAFQQTFGGSQVAAFTYTSPDFIGLFREVALGDLDACSLAVGTCGPQRFYVDATPLSGGPDRYDVIGLGRAGSSGVFGGAYFFYYFENGALGRAGVYGEGSGDFNFRLTVTEVAAPISGTPEPGTWALMVLGFGGLGAAMRRRKAL